jgi:hypothetical protein
MVGLQSTSQSYIPVLGGWHKGPGIHRRKCIREHYSSPCNSERETKTTIIGRLSKSLSVLSVLCGPLGWTCYVSLRTTCLVRLHSSWLKEYSWILWDCKFLSLRWEFPSGVICAVGTRDTPKEIVLEKTLDPSAGRPGLPQLFQWADELGTNNPFSFLICVLWLRSEPWMVLANSRLRDL